MAKNVRGKMGRRWRGQLLAVLVGALVLGVGGGVAVTRLHPGAAAWVGDLLGGRGRPTMGAVATATSSTGSPAALFQQFNAALTSYAAQPMDAHTGLRLIIPKIHVNAPIVERGIVNGWMVVAPGATVTHFVYSAYPGAVGNAVLYSHAGTTFRHLDSLGVGDTIVVQTPNGMSQFRVREMLIVPPTMRSVLDDTQTATLTLLTCYPFGVDSSRLVVVADLVTA